VLRLRVEPSFAIGQQAHLIGTPDGNVLWDCLPLLDDATYQLVAGMGGLDAIAISHPHFYTGMVEWSRAFDDAPIYLHAADREWVTRECDALVYWNEPRVELLPGATLVHCGGHFPGSAALHVASAGEDEGALFTGDTVQVGPSRDRVGFMYSYPNHIPLGPRAIRRIARATSGLRFVRLYGSFGDVLETDGDIIQRSARRYLEALSDGT